MDDHLATAVVSVAFLGEEAALARLRSEGWVVGLVMNGHWMCNGMTGQGMCDGSMTGQKMYGGRDLLP